MVKGDKCKVVDKGRMYSTYGSMADKLGLKNWDSGTNLENGTEVVFFKSAPHKSDPDKLVCHVVKDGKDYLIGHQGLSKITVPSAPACTSHLKYVRGDQVRITSNCGGHHIPIGTVVTIDGFDGGSYYTEYAGARRWFGDIDVEAVHIGSKRKNVSLFKVGDVVKITGNTSRHGFVIGDSVEIISIPDSRAFYRGKLSTGEIIRSNEFYEEDCSAGLRVVDSSELYRIHDWPKYYPCAAYINETFSLGGTNLRDDLKPKNGTIVRILNRSGEKCLVETLKERATNGLLFQYVIDKNGLKLIEEPEIKMNPDYFKDLMNKIYTYQPAPFMKPTTFAQEYSASFYNPCQEGLVFKIDTPVKLKAEKIRDAVSTSHSEGETKMSTQINVQSLARIASSDLEKDLKNLDVQLLGTDIQDALKEELANERKASAKAAAGEIIKALKLHDARVQDEVECIRTLKKEIENRTKRAKALNRAKAYGMETQNFLPLLKVAGTYVGGYTDIVTDVPEAWEPKVNPA